VSYPLKSKGSCSSSTVLTFKFSYIIDCTVGTVGYKRLAIISYVDSVKNSTTCEGYLYSTCSVYSCWFEACGLTVICVVKLRVSKCNIIACAGGDEPDASNQLLWNTLIIYSVGKQLFCKCIQGYLRYGQLL
jgi:hypothetical protein